MRSDLVFPSLGSTMGGVTHSYVVSEGAGASSGSMGGPLTYVAFQHPGSTGQPITVQDEIRTIFITGFPDNVNERELHNLCRFIPGYEASQVSIKPNQQPQVFVLFSSAAHARQALEAIAGLPFDVQQPMMHAMGGKPPGSESAGTAATTSSTSMSTAVLNTQTGSSEGRLMSPTDTSNASKAVAAPAAAPAGDSASTMGRLQQFVGGSTQSSTGPSPAPQLMQHSSNSSLSNVVVGQGMRPAPDSQTTGLASSSSPAGGHMFHTVQLLPPVKYNLRCEMAHKNLYVKDGDPSVRRPHRQIVLLNNPLHMHSGMGSSGAVGHPAPAPTAGPTTTMAGASGGSYVHDLNPMYAPSTGASGVPHTLTVHPLMTAATGPPQSLTVQHSGGVSSVPMGTPLGFLPVTNRGDNPPCNTLFIGNLSDQVSELELLHLLSGQPGYRQMKLVRGPRQVSCFVEFEDTVSATAVHNSYQGAVLASSDRGGIRIQYSKNPFGRRSSNPGSNMAALRSAVSMQGSSDIASTVSNWPVVTYHTMQQPARMGQPMTQPQLQGQHTITYY